MNSFIQHSIGFSIQDLYNNIEIELALKRFPLGLIPDLIDREMIETILFNEARIEVPEIDFSKIENYTLEELTRYSWRVPDLSFRNRKRFGPNRNLTLAEHLYALVCKLGIPRGVEPINWFENEEDFNPLRMLLTPVYNKPNVLKINEFDIPELRSGSFVDLKYSEVMRRVNLVAPHMVPSDGHQGRYCGGIADLIYLIGEPARRWAAFIYIMRNELKEGRHILQNCYFGPNSWGSKERDSVWNEGFKLLQEGIKHCLKNQTQLGKSKEDLIYVMSQMMSGYSYENNEIISCYMVKDHAGNLKSTQTNSRAKGNTMKIRKWVCELVQLNYPDDSEYYKCNRNEHCINPFHMTVKPSRTSKDIYRNLHRDHQIKQFEKEYEERREREAEIKERENMLNDEQNTLSKEDKELYASLTPEEKEMYADLTPEEIKFEKMTPEERQEWFENRPDLQENQ